MSDDLFDRTITLLDEGSFTATGDLLGAGFDHYFEKWHKEGRFGGKEDLLAEAFTCAAWLGHERTVNYLLEHREDPNGGIKTGLNALHWAASRGKPGIMRLLLDRGGDPERRNMYGGTVLGQALWSAVNEAREGQAEAIEILIEAGALIEPGTQDWWNEQDLDPAVKERVAKLLSR